MRVMSRVSARPMGRMLQWQSVASSRGDRRLREEDDLELGEVPSPRPPKEGSGAASATSSTNSQMLGAVGSPEGCWGWCGDVRRPAIRM